MELNDQVESIQRRTIYSYILRVIKRTPALVVMLEHFIAHHTIARFTPEEFSINSISTAHLNIPRLDEYT